MKALIGIDGSEHSFTAAALAGQLLSSDRDQIVLYHACAPVRMGEEVDESLHERACQAVANVVFEEAKMRLAPPLRAHVETILGDDRTGEALIETAERLEAELVALGARGLGRMEGLLLGSVSNSVVRRSRIPVLVARHGVTQSSGEFRILMAYDSISAAYHAEFLTKLNWPVGSIGHVAAVIESMALSHLPDWIQRRARDADTEAMSQGWVLEHELERTEKVAELKSFIAQLPAPFQSTPPLVVEGNPAEQLLKLVDVMQPSLVVVGKAMKNFLDRWFLGSVSEKVLAHAACSVLVIPTPHA
jgi:nucleotide-binding universal stress UspA family protein